MNFATVVGWFKPEPIGPDTNAALAGGSVRASKLRDEAVVACRAGDWTTCSLKLDEAKGWILRGRLIRASWRRGGPSPMRDLRTVGRRSRRSRRSPTRRDVAGACCGCASMDSSTFLIGSSKRSMIPSAHVGGVSRRGRSREPRRRRPRRGCVPLAGGLPGARKRSGARSGGVRAIPRLHGGARGDLLRLPARDHRGARQAPADPRAARLSPRSRDGPLRRRGGSLRPRRGLLRAQSPAGRPGRPGPCHGGVRPRAWRLGPHGRLLGAARGELWTDVHVRRQHRLCRGPALRGAADVRRRVVDAALHRGRRSAGGGLRGGGPVPHARNELRWNERSLRAPAPQRRAPLRGSRLQAERGLLLRRAPPHGVLLGRHIGRRDRPQEVSAIGRVTVRQAERPDPARLLHDEPRLPGERVVFLRAGGIPEHLLWSSRADGPGVRAGRGLSPGPGAWTHVQEVQVRGRRMLVR
jgi:hypothetical protein